MSHIPEDRHKHGLVLDYSLENNMVLQRYWQPEFQKAALSAAIRCANIPISSLPSTMCAAVRAA